MKLKALGLAAILALVASTIRAEDATSDGWISLFDGKTLNGWKAGEHAENWRVEDGAIVATGPRSHLFYIGSDPSKPAEFQNFQFKAEVMTRPGSNSGIYFHTKFEPNTWPTVGYECQVNNTHGDPVKSGSIYNVVRSYVIPAEDNKWFTEEIIVTGKNIVTKVNGKVIVDYTEPDGALAGTRKLSQGTFALQAHDPKSMTLYRNIVVKPLLPKVEK
jgi:hypothetical protein